MKPATVQLAGQEIYRLGFGAMRLCGPGILGWPADRENALAVLRRAVELGVQLIDTADAYGPEVNELQVAEALHPYRDDVVIATKGGLLRRGGAWPPDGRPVHLKAACEASLQRLRLDAIDLYQLHRPDPKVPYAESVGALRELVDEGKVRHVGVSNVRLAQLELARSIVPVAAVQNAYSLADRSSDDVLDACERDGIPFLPWYPLDAGSLARTSRLEREATPAQLALAWLLRRSPAMLPIPGTSSLAHLEENVGAASLELSDEDMAALAA